MLNKIKNILHTTIYIIFFYIIVIVLNKNYENLFSIKLFTVIIATIFILHILILCNKNLEQDYRSMMWISILTIFIPIIFLTKFFLKQEYNNITNIKIISFISLVLYILIHITHSMKILYVKIHNPTFIFILSFIILSVSGAFCLMLPSATVKNISFIDALFTSTSSVCVTGLSVLNISKDLTYIGKIILLILIELGGLGLLTITSFFNYFFQNNLSFKEIAFISEFLKTKKTNNVLILAVKVVLLSLIIEIIGALLIYLSIDKNVTTLENGVFFSIFHSISSFCNSGFSTLDNGLYSKSTRYNYLLQLFISILFILGGIGFNILINFFKNIKLIIKKIFCKIFYRNKHTYYPVYNITLNTKIVLFTTIFLLLSGTLFYYVNEYNNILIYHNSIYGKLIVSFFSSSTSRTAGFNVINMKNLHNTTILFTIFSMWIGASPSSTGGGIKTSTFAISILNMLSIFYGKKKLEICGREISNKSVNLSFAIIILSLIITYIGSIIIILLEPEQNILPIVFEVFSAFSTTGLSLGITSNLSNCSKLVIILLMFLGRIGVLNIIVGLFKNNKISYSKYYKLPKENIIIN